jgi:hypothetical protein
MCIDHFFSYDTGTKALVYSSYASRWKLTASRLNYCSHKIPNPLSVFTGTRYISSAGTVTETSASAGAQLRSNLILWGGGADPFSEKLCLETTKTMDNVQNNDHVYCKTLSSETLKICRCLRVGLYRILPVIASLHSFMCEDIVRYRVYTYQRHCSHSFVHLTVWTLDEFATHAEVQALSKYLAHNRGKIHMYEYIR